MVTTSALLERYKNLHEGRGSFIYRGEVTQQFEELWDGRCFEQKLLPVLTSAAKKRDSFSVLDYGCGKARYLPDVHARFGGRLQQWFCYDPGFNRYAVPPHPSQQFDFVVCADVMEHVLEPEYTIVDIANRLADDGIAMFSISGRPDSRQFDDGLNMHVSLRTFREWRQVLEEHFGSKKVILIYNNTHYWESWHATV